jgi:hypothetical protein
VFSTPIHVPKETQSSARVPAHAKRRENVVVQRPGGASGSCSPSQWMTMGSTAVNAVSPPTMASPMKLTTCTVAAGTAVRDHTAPSTAVRATLSSTTVGRNRQRLSAPLPFAAATLARRRGTSACKRESLYPGCYSCNVHTIGTELFPIHTAPAVAVSMSFMRGVDCLVRQ